MLANVALTYPAPGMGRPRRSAEAMFALAIVLRHRLLREAEALPYYQQICEIEPDEPRYWYVLGDLLDKLDRGAEALAAFGRALDLDPPADMPLDHHSGLIPEPARPDSTRRATASRAPSSSTRRNGSRGSSSPGCTAGPARPGQRHRGVRAAPSRSRRTMFRGPRAARPPGQSSRRGGRTGGRARASRASAPDSVGLACLEGWAHLALGAPLAALAIATAPPCTGAADELRPHCLHIAALCALSREHEAVAVCEVLHGACEALSFDAGPAAPRVVRLVRALVARDRTILDLDGDDGAVHAGCQPIARCSP